MTRFRTEDYRAKGFGQTALCVALGRGRGWGSKIAADAMVARGEGLDDLPRLVAAAENDTRLDMFVKSGDAALLEDSGISEWTPFAQAFLEGAIEQSLLGRMAAARRVAFSLQQISQSVSTSAAWVGEGKAKTSAPAEFSLFAVPIRKLAAISVLSNEMLKSLPAAAELIRAHLERSAVEAINAKLVSDDAGTSDAPAGLAYNASAISSSGSTSAQIVADLRAMIAALVDAHTSLDGAVFVCSPQCAAVLRMMKIADVDNSLGGIPMLTSAAASGSILLVAGSYLAWASGPVSIRASQHADVEQSPTAGATVHLWQENLVALLCESYVNWALAGTIQDTTGAPNAVVSLTSASYA